MKTLDEVIAELEDEGLFTDALHYLKVFRYAKDTLELEKDRYQEAVRNCEAAELKYRQLSGELGKNLAELRNEDQRYPNILFRTEGMYCCVCGSRLDQDREEVSDE